MDKKTSKLLLKKVKRLSKWTEGVFVNPVHWEVRGRAYYMAGFTLQKRVIATAYVTLDGGETREEAMEAQRWLSLFSDISNNLLAAGRARLRVPHSFFQKPLEVDVTSAPQLARKGQRALARLWEVQQNYERLAKAYINFYHEDVLKRGRLTEADVRHTQEQANRATLLQYRTLRELVDRSEELAAFAEFAKTTPDYSKWRRNEREFLKGLTQNRHQLQGNLEELALIEDEDFEKMEQLNLAHNRKLNDKQVKEQQQYVRYPV